MSIIASENAEIYIDNELLNGVTNFNLDRGKGTIDKTDIYSVQELFASGVKTVKATATVNYNNTDPVHEKLKDLEDVTLEYYPNGKLSGKGFSIDMLTLSWNESVPKADKITASVEFAPAGLLVKLGA